MLAESKQWLTKCICVVTHPGTWHYWDRIRDTYLSIKVMGISVKLDDATGGLISPLGQHYKLVMTAHCSKSVPLLI